MNNPTNITELAECFPDIYDVGDDSLRAFTIRPVPLRGETAKQCLDRRAAAVARIDERSKRRAGY